MATKTIGSGGDYSSISDWITNWLEQDFGSGAGVLIEDEVGQLLGESFDERNIRCDSIVTSSGARVIIEGHPSHRHSGVAANVGGGTHARINNSTTDEIFDVRCGHFECRYLEISQPADSTHEIFEVDAAGNADLRVHHCILYTPGSSSSSNRGITCGTTGLTVQIYRNIIYGFGDSGIRYTGDQTGSVIYANTVYSCGDNGIEIGPVDCTVKNNACFANDTDYSYSGSPTEANNASSDTSGSSGLQSLTTIDQFENATTSWSSTDLRTKSGSDLINSGEDLGSSPNDIDVSIRGDEVTGTWDIGADEKTIIGGDSASYNSAVVSADGETITFTFDQPQSSETWDASYVEDATKRPSFSDGNAIISVNSYAKDGESLQVTCTLAATVINGSSFTTTGTSGWITDADADFTDAWDAESITNNSTQSTELSGIIYAISGNVKDENDSNVEGAIVQCIGMLDMIQGNFVNKYTDITNSEGNYSIDLPENWCGYIRCIRQNSTTHYVCNQSSFEYHEYENITSNQTSVNFSGGNGGTPYEIISLSVGENIDTSIDNAVPGDLFILAAGTHSISNIGFVASSGHEGTASSGIEIRGSDWEPWSAFDTTGPTCIINTTSGSDAITMQQDGTNTFFPDYFKLAGLTLTHEESTSDGAHLYNTDNLIIRDCYFLNNTKRGLVVAATQQAITIDIRRCRAVSNGRQGLALDSNSSGYKSINNSIVQDCDSTATGMVLATTVDQESPSGETSLYVSDTTRFASSDYIVIDYAGDLQAQYTVASVSAGSHLVLNENLSETVPVNTKVYLAIEPEDGQGCWCASYEANGADMNTLVTYRRLFNIGNCSSSLVALDTNNSLIEHCIAGRTTKIADTADGRNLIAGLKNSTDAPGSGYHLFRHNITFECPKAGITVENTEHVRVAHNTSFENGKGWLDGLGNRVSGESQNGGLRVGGNNSHWINNCSFDNAYNDGDIISYDVDHSDVANIPDTEFSYNLIKDGSASSITDTGNITGDPGISNKSAFLAAALAYQKSLLNDTVTPSSRYNFYQNVKSYCAPENSSSAIYEAGGHLTQVNGDVTDDTTVVVNDARWFYAGDQITFESSGDALISSVNWTTNTLVLGESITVSDGEGVAYQYDGNAPTIGAMQNFGTPSTNEGSFSSAVISPNGTTMTVRFSPPDGDTWNASFTEESENRPTLSTGQVVKSITSVTAPGDLVIVLELDRHVLYTDIPTISGNASWYIDDDNDYTAAMSLNSVTNNSIVMTHPVSTISVNNLAISTNNSIFKGNDVGISFSRIDSGHSYTDWEIKEEFSDKTTIFIRTGTGSKLDSVGNVSDASDKSNLFISIDRTKNYYVRVKPNTTNWSDWMYLDLSGELRLVGGKHRDNHIVVSDDKGATSVTSNPKWLEQKTSRGVKIINVNYNKEQSRQSEPES